MRLAVALAAALLSACSGLKTYPNDLPKNLSVQTKTSSGSAIQSVYVSLGVYTVDAKCQTTYKGTVALDHPTTQVGIPTEAPVYLEFLFDRSGFFSSSRSSIDYGTVLRARAAHQYVADVSYADGLYKGDPARPHRGQRRRRASDDGQLRRKGLMGHAGAWCFVGTPSAFHAE